MGRHDERGQVSVEFLGMLPLVLLTLILLWQAAIAGYTYTVAGNAADAAVRAGATAGHTGESYTAACERGARAVLTSGFHASLDVRCHRERGLVKGEVRVRVPVLFPGTADFPWTVTSEAAAAEEG
ncbi:pilus assembly protein [Streptomyces sp. AJS327]|uniref:TadE/TadG family type IV pilus assembly protein n=1 Tax=Streptomyces sp. AJS327 TaxID=2545265 RepID=UPI0015DF9583|nr:TadE/TadG family type IV pilus assembly protein [Streptomyces sp. AJS327]MBA0051311.1 pilus assembly protein [Streptomyces sp. AJS327]